MTNQLPKPTHTVQAPERVQNRMENEKGQRRAHLGDICTKRTAVEAIQIALLQFRRPTARARESRHRLRGQHNGNRHHDWFYRFCIPLFVRYRNGFPAIFTSERFATTTDCRYRHGRTAVAAADIVRYV